MKLSPDQIIDGKYRIVRCLGQGGMGAVFLGEHTRIGRKVAIKVLHADLAGQSTSAARFQMEAQLTTRVGSSHIVDVLDMGDLADGHCFLVMEYLEGETLSDRLDKRGSLPVDELSGLVMQALDGLGKAHAARVIHRDLKPDNIFLVERDGCDFVKLLDFGVSKFLEDTHRAGPCLTVNGTLVGTPQYMSPEQARGLDLDARADLYALGVVMYECLAGDTPFSGENVQDLIFRVALENAPRLDPAILDVDPGFVALIEKAMARLPQDRFQTAEEFRLALAVWRETQGLDPVSGTSARPRSGGTIPAPPPETFAHTASAGDSARPSGTPANWSTHTEPGSAPVASATLSNEPVSRPAASRRALPLAAAAALLVAGLVSARALQRPSPSAAATGAAHLTSVSGSPLGATADLPVAGVTVEPGQAGGAKLEGSASSARTVGARTGNLAADRGRPPVRSLAGAKVEHVEEQASPAAAGSAQAAPPAANSVQPPAPESSMTEALPAPPSAPAAVAVRAQAAPASPPVAPSASTKGYKGRKYRTEL